MKLSCRVMRRASAPNEEQTRGRTQGPPLRGEDAGEDGVYGVKLALYVEGAIDAGGVEKFCDARV